ncbi:unnamed protein product [Porites lobata]|uniref:Uncharacterized protein n=1 Tax=Porites lobata TaxID=104759 RepID=A0ABN8R6Q5_9CNID|nr:unnamed protein product [Porites lobata]
MSAMKDITNLTSISSLNGHESSPERDIFVSFEAPSLRRKRTAKQASLHRFVQSSTETLENMSSEEDSSNKSGSEVEGEANSVFMTPESEPRLKASAQKRRRFRLEGSPRNSDSSSPELSRTLYGLSKVQLVDLFNALVTERHPDLEQELQGLIPEPDLKEMEKKLNYLQRKIYKSFPHSRYGSSSNTFCYRRVNTHLAAFKKECVGQGQTLLDLQLWELSLSYVLMAWSYVNGMPNWDNPSHNKSKEQCFKALAVQCKKALTNLKNSLTQEKCKDLIERMQSACEQDNQLQPCVKLLTILESEF